MTKTDLIIKIIESQYPNIGSIKKSIEIAGYERCGYTKKELVLKLESLKK